MLFTAWGVGGLILMELYQRMKKAGYQSEAFIIVGVLLVVAALLSFSLRKEPKGFVTTPDVEPDPAGAHQPEPEPETVGAS